MLFALLSNYQSSWDLAFSSVKGLCMYVLYVLYIYLVRHREKPYPILRAILVYSIDFFRILCKDFTYRIRPIYLSIISVQLVRSHLQGLKADLDSTYMVPYTHL